MNSKLKPKSTDKSTTASTAVKASVPVADESTPVARVTPVESAPVDYFRPAEKLITFEQFVALKKIKPQHVGGIRMHCGDTSDPRSLSDWELLVAGY